MAVDVANKTSSLPLVRSPMERAQVAVEPLSVFAPAWAFAMLFSLAGNPFGLSLRQGELLFSLLWASVLAAILLVQRPRSLAILFVFAVLVTLRYLALLPVGSNNKTIAFFMNVGIVAAVAQAYLAGARDLELRIIVYDRIRIIARGLLAVMYFYGIFHKINTDFFNPDVSCAVALYRPLAEPFGLDGNVYGRYLAIWATFIVEAITIIALYWRRYFAVGLIIGLTFHYVIPISAYSWYMDFSSLVFALYLLSIPPQVSQRFGERIMSLAALPRRWFGDAGPLALLALVLLFCVLLIGGLSAFYPPRTPMQLYHSVWALIWALVGGGAMILLVHAALDDLPYRGPSRSRQPIWVYMFPFALFVSCLSPYVGLKTESSINMFSNLHTEAGQTNHLLFSRPPYLFDYQRDTVAVLESSHNSIRKLAAKKQHMVMFDLKEFLRRNPEHWITYEQHGVITTRATGASFAPNEHANWWERTFLIFKPVDFARPKVCTH